MISGEISRVVGRDYRISQPTTLKYANDVIEMLRGREDVESAPSLRTFLARSLKQQSFQYPDDSDVKELLEPILAPFLEEAEAIDFAEREGADSPLSTRVNSTTYGRFQRIVAQLALDRPDLTPSELLREIIESYCEQAVVPAPNVHIADLSQLHEELSASIMETLKRHKIIGA